MLDLQTCLVMSPTYTKREKERKEQVKLFNYSRRVEYNL